MLLLTHKRAAPPVCSLALQVCSSNVQLCNVRCAWLGQILGGPFDCLIGEHRASSTTEKTSGFSCVCRQDASDVRDWRKRKRGYGVGAPGSKCTTTAQGTARGGKDAEVTSSSSRSSSSMSIELSSKEAVPPDRPRPLGRNTKHETRRRNNAASSHRFALHRGGLAWLKA